MNTPFVSLLIVIAGTFAVSLAAPNSEQEYPMHSISLAMLEQSPKSEMARTAEEDAYTQATKALNQSDYSKAAAGFDDIAKMNGRRAEGALYWKAYAQNKLGQRSDALASIAELRRAYPQSRWLREAGALEIEIRKSSGDRVNPEAEKDEELKLIALDSLMQSDDERAIPLLRKFLNGNASPKLKDRALFVLSQSGRPEAQQVLGDVALGKQYPELQEKAIHYLGIEGGDRSGERLQAIYDGSPDAKIKKSVLHALMVSGDEQRVFAIAQKENTLELKKDAIHQLGVMGAHNELRKLYKQTTTNDAKKEILHSMGIGGDTDGLIEAAKSETDPDVRASAIHGLGIGGGKRGNEALVSMYPAQNDKQTKKQIIDALFIQGAATQLVALAKKESDPEMKKAIVSKLSVMGSREANEYLMEILNQ
jgi:HEAT repeat protein